MFDLSIFFSAASSSATNIFGKSGFQGTSDGDLLLNEALVLNKLSKCNHVVKLRSFCVRQGKVTIQTNLVEPFALNPGAPIRSQLVGILRGLKELACHGMSLLPSLFSFL
jgi:hypothetical protein